MLAKEKPDLVQVATPPGTHCNISVQCMEAGALGHVRKAFVRIAGAGRPAGRRGEAHRQVCLERFSDALWVGAQHLKKLISENALGKPLLGLCNTTWYRDEIYYSSPWRGKWSTELGGPSMNHGIHTMDLFMYLLGDFSEVRAMIGTLERKLNVEDVSMAIVKFENNVMGSIVNSVLCPRQESHVRIDFQKATVEAKYLYGYTNKDWTYTPMRDSPESQQVLKLAEIPTEIPVLHGIQTAAMLDAMDRNQPPGQRQRGSTNHRVHHLHVQGRGHRPAGQAREHRQGRPLLRARRRNPCRSRSAAIGGCGERVVRITVGWQGARVTAVGVCRLWCRVDLVIARFNIGQSSPIWRWVRCLLA